MKRFIPFGFAVVAAIAVWGCSGGAGKDEPKPESTPSTSSGKAPEGEFKVALLTPGPVSDAGWSAMAYDGLKAIETELAAKVDNAEAKGAGIKDSLRSYAQKGYNLVFGHGFEYNEPSIEVAKDFPNTVFVSSSGGGTAANVGAFRFYLEQGFYLAGMTAGLMSKTGVVAMVGGPDVPSIRSTFKAFRAGAEAAKPGIKVLEIFTGQDADVAAAKLATLNVLSQKADFVIHQANAAAQGVFDACKQEKAFAFGANLDQNNNPSGVILGSAIIVAKPAFLDLAKQVKLGTYKGQVSLFGMDKGAIDYVWNPALASAVPDAVKAKIEETKKKILSGELIVPKDEF